MNTLIWIGIVLIAWCRPIDIDWKKTYTVWENGRVVKHKETDYIKNAAWIVAIVLIVIGVVYGV